MTIDMVINYIVSILSGLCVCIPLVYKLVITIQSNIREKNWSKLLELVMNLMAEAEKQFDNGADKKAWVLGIVESSAGTINYDIDLVKVGELIDSLCAMSKSVNTNKE